MSPFHSSEEHLRRIFYESFTAVDIAEPLVSFDDATSAKHVRSIMEERGFDVVGVREKGIVVGFARMEELKDGTCKDHIHVIEEEVIRPDSTPLPEIIRTLGRHERVFIEMLDNIGGLVTRFDLQKPPVRMWLFGVISLFEVVMTRLIRERFPKGEWKELVSEGRLRKAESFWKERKRRKQEMDLVDCLQYSDKGHILNRIPEVREQLRVPSRREGEERIKALEALRNNLAHGQDIVKYDWEAIVRIAENLDGNLSRVGGMRLRSSVDNGSE